MSDTASDTLLRKDRSGEAAAGGHATDARHACAAAVSRIVATRHGQVTALGR
jgi:hypothetical protein